MPLQGIYTFPLKSYQLDHRGRMPIWVIYHFLQESAEHNAVDLGFDTETLLQRGLTWVLSRLQLRVTAFPQGRQGIEAETWPSAIESRFAHRDFCLRIPGELDCFAIASSAWLLLDFNRMRPVTVSTRLPEKMVLHRPRMVATPFPQLDATGDPVFTKEFAVRRSDLDINDHVNNVHYVEWLAEAVPESLWRNADISELDVEYKRAVKYGDTLVIATFNAGDNTFIHCMSVSGQPGDVLRARSVWKQLEPGR
jgi:medium-chain acyl-[acyl-carrier-protein] hydrolase